MAAISLVDVSQIALVGEDVLEIGVLFTWIIEKLIYSGIVDRGYVGLFLRGDVGLIGAASGGVGG